jgi:hypothetical protein
MTTDTDKGLVIGLELSIGPDAANLRRKPFVPFGIYTRLE